MKGARDHRGAMARPVCIYLSVSCRFTAARGLAFHEKCTNLPAGVFALVHVHHGARLRFLVVNANNGATPCICLELFIPPPLSLFPIVALRTVNT